MYLQELFTKDNKKFAKKYSAVNPASDQLEKRNKISKAYTKFKDHWGNEYSNNRNELIKKLIRNTPLDTSKVHLPEQDLNEAAPGWSWASEWDEKMFISFQSLVKNNNGLFKSAKQAAYLGDPSRYNDKARTDIDNLKNWFGVNVDTSKGEIFALSVEAYMQFAKYGAKSLRPITYYFVFDKYGVTKKYQLHYVGDLKKGTRPDPKKTELKWERPANTDTTQLDKELNQASHDKANPPAPTSKHIGNIGDRLTFDLTTRILIDRGIGQFGQQWLNVFETSDGNVVMYNGYLSKNKGEQLKVKATVKKHIVGKDGNPITIISHPKKL